MPQPLADAVWSKRRNQDTMVQLAGGVEAASSTDEPLRFQTASRIPEMKQETWKRPQKKDRPRKPEKFYNRYVRRDPKTKRFLKKLTNEEVKGRYLL